MTESDVVERLEAALDAAMGKRQRVNAIGARVVLGSIPKNKLKKGRKDAKLLANRKSRSRKWY